jgi:nitrate reductase gamma subunit
VKGDDRLEERESLVYLVDECSLLGSCNLLLLLMVRFGISLLPDEQLHANVAIDCVANGFSAATFNEEKGAFIEHGLCKMLHFLLQLVCLEYLLRNVLNHVNGSPVAFHERLHQRS